MSDGIPTNGGRWLPDDDSGPDRLAMEAGVETYADYADLRSFMAQLDDVIGGYDIEVMVALHRAEWMRARLPEAERALEHGSAQTWVWFQGELARAEGIARAWCDLAGFP